MISAFPTVEAYSDPTSLWLMDPVDPDTVYQRSSAGANFRVGRNIVEHNTTTPAATYTLTIPIVRLTGPSQMPLSFVHTGGVTALTIALPQIPMISSTLRNGNFSQGALWWTATAPAAQVNVSGAGIEDANGVYVKSGDTWSKAETLYTIAHDGDTEKWTLFDDGVAVYETGATAGVSPSEGTWVSVDPDDNPAPTVEILTGWTIADEKAYHGGAVGNNDLLQDFSNEFDQPRTLRVQVAFTIQNYVSGSVRPRAGVDGTSRSANGTFTETLDVTSHGGIGFRPASFVGEIVDVSVTNVGRLINAPTSLPAFHVLKLTRLGRNNWSCATEIDQSLDARITALEP